MTQNGNIITADEGKLFRRIEDEMVYGKEISLGYTYYIGGVKLDTPHEDKPEDFEEIDDSKEEETNNVVNNFKLSNLFKVK